MFLTHTQNAYHALMFCTLLALSLTLHRGLAYKLPTQCLVMVIWCPQSQAGCRHHPRVYLIWHHHLTDCLDQGWQTFFVKGQIVTILALQALLRLVTSAF